jgi:glucose-1-phosphate thymidylyltransferase
MKGIILAGGTGSRLLPLTKVTNKSLLPVGNKPMVIHCLDLLVQSNIEDIMLVTGVEHMGQVISLLGSGSEFGCSLTYKVQDSANGIAAALGLCKTFVGNDKCCVVLGDNIFQDTKNISLAVRDFSKSNDDYLLFSKEVPDPQRFGVPVFDKNGKIIDVIEKPSQPPSEQAIVGLYCYSSEVFDTISTLKPSPRGEYEISDVNKFMVKNRNGTLNLINSGWVDAGTHESFQKANLMLWGKL